MFRHIKMQELCTFIFQNPILYLLINVIIIICVAIYIFSRIGRKPQKIDKDPSILRSKPHASLHKIPASITLTLLLHEKEGYRIASYNHIKETT